MITLVKHRIALQSKKNVNRNVFQLIEWKIILRLFIIILKKEIEFEYQNLPFLYAVEKRLV